jgi:HD-like signal output (HDOD) protein
MINKIIEKINDLPPLPETITKIEIFRKKESQEVEELIAILETDPFIVSTLLKVSNSAMFGFRSKVETLGRLINLLGMKFAIFIAINETIQNMLTTDLKPYGITHDDYVKSTRLTSSLINLWISKKDVELKDDLILPALLQQTGLFILSEVIISNNLTEKFQEKLALGTEISEIEKELLGVTTSLVTAEIFKHWKLSENLIQTIEYVDELNKCDEEFLKKAQILHIAKILCNPKEPFSTIQIAKALRKAKEFNFGETILKKSIEVLEDRLLDEK